MHNEIGLMALVLAIADALVAISSLFVACELGQRVSDAFQEISDIVDEFNWYRFPNELNRLLPVIMAVVQKPVEVDVFGKITCCRYILKTVSSGDCFCTNFYSNLVDSSLNIFEIK